MCKLFTEERKRQQHQNILIVNIRSVVKNSIIIQSSNLVTKFVILLFIYTYLFTVCTLIHFILPFEFVPPTNNVRVFQQREKLKMSCPSC